MKLEYQILAAVAMDFVLGDPRWLPHPVRAIGWMAARLESAARRLAPASRWATMLAGLVVALLVYTIAGAAAWGAIRLGAIVGHLAADIVGVLIIYTTIAARDLASHGMAVFRALAAGDLVEARRRVGFIVGRDTATLDESGVVRATVESIAESTVDGVTAPLLFAIVAGPVGAMVYRAINTLDSMFGHQDERYIHFGWAAARIDDMANYIPARLTAPMLCLAAMLLGQRPIQAARIVLRDRRKHRSPNSGLAEAAVAGALGVQLGGLNYYDGQPLDRPAIGDPLVPLAPRHIPLANAMMWTASGLLLALGLSLRLGALHLWQISGGGRMNNAPCPRLVIAGTGSGVGKTSLAVGIARALARQGMRVQTFKVGPDYLDPTYLARASGRTCYNLDAWMTPAGYVQSLFERTTADADIAIIEGVMGLFDGASPTALEGSTAEIALLLDAPVVLVVNAHGAARSLAATVKGFVEFEPDVRVVGAIANRTGSSRHKAWLDESLGGAKLPPLLGAVPRGSLPTLQGRHLGLVAAEHGNVDEATLDALADAYVVHIDAKSLVAAAKMVGLAAGQGPARSTHPTFLDPPGVQRHIRLGIARDAAFSFYYPDNLEMLTGAGAELTPFSPLDDSELPADLDGIYFGGGYPEVHAEQLAANAAMRAAVANFAASGGAIYAECGGLMYLGRSLKTLDGSQFPMTGVLPIDTAMLPSLKTLGYAEVALAGDSLWGHAGDVCRGHEFHYSEIVADDSRADGWRPAYAVRRRHTGGVVAEGFAKGRLLASYIHLHWASRPQVVDRFIACCQGEKHE